MLALGLALLLADPSGLVALQDALRRDDPAAVAERVRFPLRVTFGGTPLDVTRDRFPALYDAIFNGPTVGHLLSLTPDTLADDATIRLDAGGRVVAVRPSARPDLLARPAPPSWPAAAARRLSVEATDDELAFLGPLLAGKRIVALGENTHGVREYNVLKARIVDYLHRELGFELLAFESAYYQCDDADRTAATATAVQTLTRCAYGVWHAPELLPLFETIRASHASDRPLRLAGFDVQPIGNNKDDRPGFLAAVVGPDAGELDARFLEIYARGGRDRRAFFRSADGAAMADAYDALATRLAGRDDRDGRVAHRTAASMAAYIRQQAAPTTREYVERRDRGMAENLAFLVDTVHPGARVVVWGHNFHLRHANEAIEPVEGMWPDAPARTAGHWLKARYGDALYTVGVYAGRGRAADNSGTPFAIPPAAPDSLEGRLRAVGASALFVDLSDAPRGPMTARHDGRHPLAMVVPDQYDAILYVDEVSPRGRLGRAEEDDR